MRGCNDRCAGGVAAGTSLFDVLASESQRERKLAIIFIARYCRCA